MLRFGSLCGRLSLFVSGLSSDSRIFYSYVEVIIISERLQILTYARYLWPLSSEVSQACYTFCHTEHPSIMVSSRTHKTHSCCWAFSSGAVATFFKDLCLSRLGFEHPTSACWANALSYCATAAALMSEAVNFLSYFGTTGSYVKVIFMTDNKSLNLLKFVFATFELSLFTCTRYNTWLVS